MSVPNNSPFVFVDPHFADVQPGSNYPSWFTQAIYPPVNIPLEQQPMNNLFFPLPTFNHPNNINLAGEPPDVTMMEANDINEEMEEPDGHTVTFLTERYLTRQVIQTHDGMRHIFAYRRPAISMAKIRRWGGLNGRIKRRLVYLLGRKQRVVPSSNTPRWPWTRRAARMRHHSTRVNRLPYLDAFGLPMNTKIQIRKRRKTTEKRRRREAPKKVSGRFAVENGLARIQTRGEMRCRHQEKMRHRSNMSNVSMNHQERMGFFDRDTCNDVLLPSMTATFCAASADSIKKEEKYPKRMPCYLSASIINHIQFGGVARTAHHLERARRARHNEDFQQNNYLGAMAF